MTRNDILKLSNPGDIFARDEVQCKIQYRKFAKYYHPDGTRSDAEVFEHITKLYHEALKLFKKGEWQKSNYIELKTENGSSLQVNYLSEFSFELGKCYVSRNHVIYILESNKKKYYLNYIKNVSNIKYANNEMKKIFSRIVPDIKTYGMLVTGEHYIVVKKTEDVYPLGSLLSFLKEVPAKHVAWIISRLSSFCCFLEYNGLVFNGIDLNSCFVSPKYHAVMLFGGWWYVTQSGAPLVGTTKEIYDLMPVVAKTKKIADTATDLEAVKQVGRLLVAANSHQKIMQKADIPKEIKDFLTRGSGSDAVNEMALWDLALNQAYGARKFIELNVTENQIYYN